MDLEDRVKPVKEWDVLDLSQNHDDSVVADMYRLIEYLRNFDRNPNFNEVLGQIFADTIQYKDNSIFLPGKTINSDAFAIYTLQQELIAKVDSERRDYSKNGVISEKGIEKMTFPSTLGIDVSLPLLTQLSQHNYVLVNNGDGNLNGISQGNHLIAKINNGQQSYLHFAKIPEQSFSESEEQMACCLAKNISRKFWNTSEAMLDPLTKAINQTYWSRVLSEKVKVANRQNKPYSIMLADIDNFKALNSEIGHVAADAVLTQMAEIFKYTTRTGQDIIARYAGDEFVMFLESDEHRAKEIGEKINNQLKNYQFLDHNKNPLKLNQALSLSMGLISSSQNFYTNQVLEQFPIKGPQDYEPLTVNLVSLADDASEHVKLTSKGQVEIFKPEMMGKSNKKLYNINS